jgi:hypothetical protein
VMPSYTIKVPNDDEGEDLGEYEADYLPRVGDPFVLWHPRVCAERDKPFCGVVSAVTHEVIHSSHPYALEHPRGRRSVVTTVWLAEEHAPPTLYCVCTEEERSKWKVEADGRCENCGHMRKS